MSAPTLEQVLEDELKNLSSEEIDEMVSSARKKCKKLLHLEPWDLVKELDYSNPVDSLVDIIICVPNENIDKAIKNIKNRGK